MANWKHHRPQGRACLATSVCAPLPHRGERALVLRESALPARPPGIWNGHAKPKPASRLPSRARWPPAAVPPPQAVPVVLRPQRGSRLPPHCGPLLCSEPGSRRLQTALNLLTFCPTFPARGKCGAGLWGCPAGQTLLRGTCACQEHPGGLCPHVLAQPRSVARAPARGQERNPSLAEA